MSESSGRSYVLINSVRDTSKRNAFNDVQVGTDYSTPEEAEAAIPQVAEVNSLDSAELRVIHKLALKREDKEYWKNRSKRLKKITPKSSPEFLIERFSSDGTVRSSSIRQSGEIWERTEMGIDQAIALTDLGEFPNLVQALTSQPDMLEIGNETTFIHTNGDLHEVLINLVPLASASQPINLTEWETLPCYSKWDWYGEEEFFENLVNETPEHLNLHPILASLNGNRLVLAHGKGFSSFMLLDEYNENLEPLITDVLLEDFWFSDGGGAPVSWEGRTTIGLSGPNVFVNCISGDWDPGFTVSIADSERDEVALVTEYILNAWHGGEAFLLNYIGFTDLPEGPYVHSRDTQFDDPGHQITVELPSEDILKVLDEVENSTEHLKEVANALRDSKTEMGKKIYSHLDDIGAGRDSIWTVISILRGDEE